MFMLRPPASRARPPVPGRAAEGDDVLRGHPRAADEVHAAAEVEGQDRPGAPRALPVSPRDEHRARSSASPRGCWPRCCSGSPPSRRRRPYAGSTTHPGDLGAFVLRSVRDPWTLGVVAAYLAGFVLHAVAIWLLPLYLAQAAIAMSLPVTAVASTLVQERLTAVHWSAVVRRDRGPGPALRRAPARSGAVRGGRPVRGRDLARRGGCWRSRAGAAAAWAAACWARSPGSGTPGPRSPCAASGRRWSRRRGRAAAVAGVRPGGVLALLARRWTGRRCRRRRRR